MLAVAAILIAVRVALKSVAIPIAPPTLMINLGFFVNALGAMIFGPVVAILAAAISDTPVSYTHLLYLCSTAVWNNGGTLRE